MHIPYIPQNPGSAMSADAVEPNDHVVYPCLACPPGCPSCCGDESCCECYDHQDDHPDAEPHDDDD